MRLAFTNEGEYDHEFVMDTHEQGWSIRPGWRGFPTIRIGPQGKAEIVWAFTSVGRFEFACLIPGRYELGNLIS